MGDINIKNPKNLRFKTEGDEKIFSFSYPDNKFQIDKIQFVEYKSKDIVIKKKNRHKHLDYGIDNVPNGSGVVEKFHERSEIKYEKEKKRNKAKHKINYECKIAGGKKPKENDLFNEKIKQEEYFSEPELEMDFNDLFELSLQACDLSSSEESENDSVNDSIDNSVSDSVNDSVNDSQSDNDD